jgi:CDP-diacylglycerol---glycerol-3-phosphate 3-phosphatidyltransferase
LEKPTIGRVFCLSMGFADQLTLARAAAVPVVVVLFAWDYPNHDYWATGVFVAAMATDWFDGRWARRTGSTSNLGKLLDPIADKLLVIAALVMLVEDVLPGWMVAAIVAREFLVSGLRLAAIERGVVMSARDLAKWKTGAQAAAVTLGGLAAGGAFSTNVAWWAALVAVVFTWVSGLDYARVAPSVLRGRQPA